GNGPWPVSVRKDSLKSGSLTSRPQPAVSANVLGSTLTCNGIVCSRNVHALSWQSTARRSPHLSALAISGEHRMMIEMLSGRDNWVRAQLCVEYPQPSKQAYLGRVGETSALASRNRRRLAGAVYANSRVTGPGVPVSTTPRSLGCCQ